MAGSAITAQALAQGHTVTAIGRSAEKLATLTPNAHLTTVAKTPLP